jgi:hypothetical protein
VSRASVAIAGIFGKCDNITQQDDAPHKDKNNYGFEPFMISR